MNAPLSLQEHNCIEQLKEHLLSQCKAHSSSNFKQFSAYLSSERHIGLLISERLLNLPVKIGSLLLQTLLLVTFLMCSCSCRVNLVFCRSELRETPTTACELLVVIGRSHLLCTADVGKKRKARGNNSSLNIQREHHVFDYVESEFMFKVIVIIPRCLVKSFSFYFRNVFAILATQ